ncbi:DNA primase [Halobacteriales archaeon QS_8_69_26]|nr:MAG: DNA primase [Halobacteriales archaeon QS_8_69_26]
MDDTVKYLIHADVTADGVVERSDVVGAVFGQTEGLLGEELDLRGLQESSKVGRIDVDIQSRQGQSFGHITIETSLDKVATATLAAALETITRIGPCRAKVEITEIEDVRAAKRREVVDRAKELLVEGFSESVASSEEILSEVRQQVRVENITEYDGLPAGPRVTDSDAVIVVEGRADVLNLLQYGIKNAIAVEGTNVPEAVADLTGDRTVTVFLDGDRGGDLILEELSQVGEIDYVAFAPTGQSVEDLSRGDVFEALQNKVPYDAVSEMSTPREALAATDGSASPAPAESDGSSEGTGSDGPEVREADSRPVDGSGEPDAASSAGGDGDVDGSRDETYSTVEGSAAGEVTDDGADATDAEGRIAEDDGQEDDSDDADGSDDRDEAAHANGTADAGGSDEADGGSEAHGDGDAGEGKGEGKPSTLREHVEAVVNGGTGRVRLLNGSFETVAEADAEEAFDAIESAEPPPETLVLDGTLDQRTLDVAAQRGVGQVVARELGEFTKRPTNVRILTAEQYAEAAG